jgi:hypothetical protein
MGSCPFNYLRRPRHLAGSRSHQSVASSRPLSATWPIHVTSPFTLSNRPAAPLPGFPSYPGPQSRAFNCTPPLTAARYPARATGSLFRCHLALVPVIAVSDLGSPSHLARISSSSCSWLLPLTPQGCTFYSPPAERSMSSCFVALARVVRCWIWRSHGGNRAMVDASEMACGDHNLLLLQSLGSILL